MILVIRISGLVQIPNDVQETLYRMRLRQKYSAILIDDTSENAKLLLKVRNFVAYGNISEDTLKALIAARGERLDRKQVSGAMKVPTNESEVDKSGLKPFFRLHPPRGGIDGKVHFGTRKGVLGNNGNKINDLVRRML